MEKMIAGSGVMDTLKQRVAQTQAQVVYAKSEKFCPFQSTAEKPVRCSSECMLFRVKKPGYECPLMELPAISYSLAPLQGKGAQYDSAK